MIIGLALGTVIGVGLAVAFWGFFPPRKPLNIRLNELEQFDDSHNSKSILRHRLGSVAAKLSWHGGSRRHRVERDLRIVGQSAEEMAVTKLVMLLLGVGLPIGVWIISWLGHVWISPTLVATASLLTGGLLFVVPDLSLRERARNRHRELLQQISVYLDLVSLHLAGGAGLDRALEESAAQGMAWGFVEFKRVLAQAKLTNESPWTAFEKLGQELGSPELEELGSWLFLAGYSGSRVRSSLQIKARGLRERALHEAETRAQQATERMSLPVVLMFSGFLGLIGYPALAALTSA